MVRKAQCRCVKTKQVPSDRTSIAKYEMNLSMPCMQHVKQMRICPQAYNTGLFVHGGKECAQMHSINLCNGQWEPKWVTTNVKVAQVQSRQTCRGRPPSRAPSADWWHVLQLRTVNATGGKYVTMSMTQTLAMKSNTTWKPCGEINAGRCMAQKSELETIAWKPRCMWSAS